MVHDVDRVEQLSKYASEIGVSNELVKRVFASMSALLSPEEKIERKIQRTKERPSIYKKAIQRGMTVPRHEGDDVLFNAKEEALFLAVNLQENPTGIDLLKYFNGEKRFNERYTVDPTQDMATLITSQERAFLERLRGFYRPEENVTPASSGEDEFMKGYQTEIIKREHGTD